MKKHFAATLCALFVFGLAAGAAAAASKDVIPKDIRKALEAGLVDLKPTKSDIPFTVADRIIMPGPEGSVYVYLILKAKNADLGYAAPAVPPADGPTKLLSRGRLFARIYQVENGKPGRVLHEHDIPAVFETGPDGYDPEAEDWYAVGYPLRPGSYVAALAFASEDAARYGIRYDAFTLPDPAGFTGGLETSTVLVMKSFERVEAPEPPPVIRRGTLSWSVARITPNLEKTIKAGAPIDFFFYVYGTRPDAAGKPDLEVVFEVDKLTAETEVDASTHPLFLKDWTWKRTADGGPIEVTGEVKNLSKDGLSGVEALANFYDKDNKYLRHAGAPLSADPIGPSETASFKVTLEADPLVENALVEFRTAGGDAIAKTALVETALRFDKQSMQTPLISLPLPLKQTFEVRTGDKVEYKKQDLAPGRYVLVIRILDRVSGLKGEKRVEFAVR